MMAGIIGDGLVDAGTRTSAAVTFCAEAHAETTRRYKKTLSENTALPMHCPGGQKMTKPFLHLTPRAMKGLLPGEESSKARKISQPRSCCIYTSIEVFEDSHVSSYIWQMPQ